jgi:hypothetical protein
LINNRSFEIKIKIFHIVDYFMIIILKYFETLELKILFILITIKNENKRFFDAKNSKSSVAKREGPRKAADAYTPCPRPPAPTFYRSL